MTFKVNYVLVWMKLSPDYRQDSMSNITSSSQWSSPRHWKEKRSLYTDSSSFTYVLVVVYILRNSKLSKYWHYNDMTLQNIIECGLTGDWKSFKQKTRNLFLTYGIQPNGKKQNNFLFVQKISYIMNDNDVIFLFIFNCKTTTTTTITYPRYRTWCRVMESVNIDGDLMSFG